MWHGGQLGRDGMIYAIPANADRVLRIDPSRNEVALIGPVLHHGVRSKWYGGITANDGSIWGMPYNAPSALKITPPASAGVAEAQIVEVGEFPLGGWKWHGGTRSGEYVIGIPSHASAVLRIHAETNQVALLGAELEVMQGKYKWGGATTDHNGIVWAIPSDADVPLRIVPSTGEVGVVANGVIASAIGPEWKNKWQGGVLGADGDVYCIPCDAQQVLAIHTESGTVSLLGNLPAGKKKFQGGALAPDGTIWGLPESCEHILRITPPLRKRTHN
mmetsp:Transcript_25484/g.63061  ORF Transcript_25484/g.63061 Transcript_25484/m.63061 type:complete len:274 (-) Transcript_25484:214-1035(-)